jgi:hypothetical protein
MPLPIEYKRGGGLLMTFVWSSKGERSPPERSPRLKTTARRALTTCLPRPKCGNLRSPQSRGPSQSPACSVILPGSGLARVRHRPPAPKPRANSPAKGSGLWRFGEAFPSPGHWTPRRLRWLTLVAWLPQPGNSNKDSPFRSALRLNQLRVVGHLAGPLMAGWDGRLTHT